MLVVLRQAHQCLLQVDGKILLMVAASLLLSRRQRTIYSGDGQTFTGEQVMWSSDGFNWVAANQSEDAEWKAIAYGNGKYVAVSDGPIGGNKTTLPDTIA